MALYVIISAVFGWLFITKMQRHTCASLLLSLGIHPKVVQEQLGHSSISMTLDTYSHLAPNMQGEAAGALENLLN
jgi:integrase